MFKVAIIGRPNVGKSTLFNRLLGKKHAIVDDIPGVTRDRREAVIKIYDFSFKLSDTAGLEDAKKESLEYRMMEQTTIAVDESDLCLFMIDGRAGLTSTDRFFATWLRKKGKKIAMLINKCEGDKGDSGYYESLSLGFSPIIMISAEHNLGLEDLYLFLQKEVAEYNKSANNNNELEVDKQKTDEEISLQFAILGRPNTGKSTFINALLGENRVLVGPEAGITRDSIAIDFEYKGSKIKLIDTAGIRRKTNVIEKLEKLSVTDSLRALTFTHVAVLMIDATMPFEKQDLTIAELIINEGRAVVIVLNKWDQIKDKKSTLEEIDYQIDKVLPNIKGVPVVPISALKNKNIMAVLDAAQLAYKNWNKRFTTAKLNAWLRDAEQKHLPPLSSQKRRIRLKYITQGNIRPPTFTLFVNYPDELPDSYKRYLINDLRDVFDLQGVPVRMMLRKSDNPYKGKRK